MLFRRKSVAKKIWAEFHEELEPLNTRLKEKIGFPKHMHNVLWDDLVFNSATYMYAEALKCFHHNLFEASTVMCRASIDSAIFLAWQRVRTEDPTTAYIRELTALTKTERKLGWNTLRTKAIELGLLEESYMSFVEKVREKGHFSAHIAVKQEEAREKWEKKTAPLYETWQKGAPSKPLLVIPNHKRWTSPEEARNVLIDTKSILVKIIQNYFASEKTCANSFGFKET